MYARCGKIDAARHVFNEIGKRRNLCSWNSMMMGLAVHGRSNEALQLYDQMLGEGIEPDDVTFVGLILAFHSNVEFAEIAAGSLFQVEPWNPGNYVILCNIYAAAQRWDGVAKLRKLMKGGQITKAAGYSVIEGEGEIHKFIVEDKSHPRHYEIYALLNEISTKMKLQITEDDFEPELEELLLMEEM
ncbi:hypothetical protein D5086_005114 [Populus alba]|uniref:Uncharacterized protein n=1 Tax=Populus alba TaxID=43335 RepID=A0ACC4CSC5_POPAL